MAKWMAWGLALGLAGALRAAALTTMSAQGLSVTVDPVKGSYAVVRQRPAWTFSGKLGSAMPKAVRTRGSDALGPYQQIDFRWGGPELPMRGWIRLYDAEPSVLFSATCVRAFERPPAPFPDFDQTPAGLHVFSHRQEDFAPPQFAANEAATPWLLFDDQAEVVVFSPASHFMVASLLGDGHQRMASGFNPALRGLPEGFTQETLMVFGQGINRTHERWGQALLRLQGVRRLAADADATLKYLGYWTDNGATYYYHYDADKGYAGTLRALVGQYRKERIPIRYLQLDSWWYSKSLTNPDGSLGHPKNAALPEGEWNRYGGTLEYKAHPALFPQGLEAFQREIGLPFVTHNRWIDVASPYREHFKFSGLGALDPAWWDGIAAYLKSCGVATYEQDWLDRIYQYSPAFSAEPFTAETFQDEMARACAAQGITMQYCMPYPGHFLQGSRYPALTSIRTSGDKFDLKYWNDFLYTSRLASSLGIAPFSDVLRSSESANLLLATLSAGPVGIGDPLGAEDRGSLLRAVREDGVIVKPDASIVPTDASFIADARGNSGTLVASTFTQHGGLRTAYVFAYQRPQAPAGQARIRPSELGLEAKAYLFDYFAGQGRLLDPGAEFSAPLSPTASAFYVLAPLGQSGIAFLGDQGKFVGTGRQRVAGLTDEPGCLTVDLLLAESERELVLHGYAVSAPAVSALSGTAALSSYDAATGIFKVSVKPDAGALTHDDGGDPVRSLRVALKTR
jgi:hypothetical protein